MNRPAAATTTPASTCHIRVAGHLDEHWSAWLDGFALTRGDDGTTVINGPVTDQAQLHGMLVRIRDLGVPLLSLTTDCTGPRAETTAHAIQPDRSITTPLGALWSASACAANCTQPATHCTGLAGGWTRSPTPSSKRNGRRSDQPPLMPS